LFYQQFANTEYFSKTFCARQIIFTAPAALVVVVHIKFPISAKSLKFYEVRAIVRRACLACLIPTQMSQLTTSRLHLRSVNPEMSHHARDRQQRFSVKGFFLSRK